MEGSLQETRVLIAHASENARTAMRAVLEAVGCVVAEAGTRDELLAAARTAGAPSLLLHGGLGCAPADLKSDPDLFRIAVVLVDAPADVPSQRDALEEGAKDVFRGAAAGGELVA